jgi:hypothetical protein
MLKLCGFVPKTEIDHSPGAVPPVDGCSGASPLEFFKNYMQFGAFYAFSNSIFHSEFATLVSKNLKRFSAWSEMLHRST